MTEGTPMRLRLALVGLLAVPVLTAAEDTVPPPGWKQNTPKEGLFSVWMPGGKSIVRTERERTVTVRGVRIKMFIVSAENRNGLNLEAATLSLPERLVRLVPQRERFAISRDDFVSEVGGRVTGETDVTVGEAKGKEYTVQTKGGMAARLRVFAQGSQINRASVRGKKGQVASKIANTFLDSYRLLEKAPRDAAEAADKKKE